MPSLLFVADIKFKSREARDEAVLLLYKVTGNAWANEPGTTRYLVCLPIDTRDQTSIYMVEGYSSTQAQETHRKAAPTAALFKAFGAGLLASAPVTSTLPPAASFQRPGWTTLPTSAVIILTTFGYQRGKTSFALDGWRALASHAAGKEPGALAVDVTEDVNESKIHSVQVFDSATSADAHVNGQAIQANRQHNGSVRTGERSIVRLSVLYGFLGK
ncbi:hypothetical protein EJ08DRAFT_20743 [Tothia fuscella]|uniref:ABM domain-containing protein n=1 Tax=Tothia fuscella TaxID=1048955 RepID=A0A9P4NYH7_9PEZI|nr:hypothetical protein EJ08DRAFT_20743 [Tothia fuscella]